VLSTVAKDCTSEMPRRTDKAASVLTDIRNPILTWALHAACVSDVLRTKQDASDAYPYLQNRLNPLSANCNSLPIGNAV
jgi:hypothetical protein